MEMILVWLDFISPHVLTAGRKTRVWRVLASFNSSVQINDTSIMTDMLLCVDSGLVHL